MRYNDYHPEDDPIYDLRIAAQNYWCGQTGQEEPPDPSYRMVDGEWKLGRLMGPYECLMHLEDNRNLWRRWYSGFLTGSGIGVVLAGVSVVILPVYIIWYLLQRRTYQRQYDFYFRKREEIDAAGKPLWVAYDKVRLDLIGKNPLAVYP